VEFINFCQLKSNFSSCSEQTVESPAKRLYCLFLCWIFLRDLIFVLLEGLFNLTISSFVNYATMKNSHQFISVSPVPAYHPWKLAAKQGD